MRHRWICLMYHNVAEESPGMSGGRSHFGVSRDSFERQLDLISGMGFSVCSMAEAVDSIRPVVAVTFDDGDIGQFEHAFAALVTRGMSATFFVTTSWVGRPGFVTWSQLKEMKNHGMSIQSHSKSHPFLSELTEHVLRDELYSSKQELDDKLGQETDSFALPGGDFPRKPLRYLLGEAGYRTVATSRWGINAPHEGAVGYRCVRRCTVRGTVSDSRFRDIVTGNRVLAVRRHVRGGVLGALRRTIGPTKYARWRSQALAKFGTFEE